MTDRLIRFTTAATVVMLGAIAAVVSYRHAIEVIRAHGERGPTSYLVPLTVDGLVLVASMVLLDCSRRGDRSPLLARGALGLGIAATVAVNVLHGVAHGPIGATVAAWPAVCLVLVVELLMGMIRRSRSIEDDRTTVPVAIEGPQVSELRSGAQLPDAETMVSAGLPAPEGEQLVIADVPEGDPALVALVATAQDHFAETLATGRLPSVRSIRRELRLGHPRATRVRAALEPPGTAR